MASGVKNRWSRKRRGGVQMRNGLVLSVGILGALSTALTVGAQVRRPVTKAYTAPRLPDGHPDLQGIYDLATLTPLERPAGMKATLTDEEAAKMERDVATQNELRGRPISADRTAPPKGGDGSTGA